MTAQGKVAGRYAGIPVRIEEPGWLDDVSVPGEVRPVAAGSWRILRAEHYRQVRQARVEEVTRVLVVRTYQGREYLHAVTPCGRLVADMRVRVNVPEVLYADPAPDPEPVQVRQYPAVPGGYVVRKGCGCGGVR